MNKYIFIIFVLILLTSCNESVELIVESNSPAAQGILLKESIGIETLGGVFTPLLNSGCNLPCEITQIFSTAEDNQNQIKLILYRGTKKLSSKNKLLGNLKITGIKPASRGKPKIQVKFRATNGKIIIAVKDLDGTSKLKLLKYE